MEEASLRKRVNEIRKSDPEFYAQMLDWRDEYKRRTNKREGLWDDKLYKRKGIRQGRLVDIIYTIDDALRDMYDAYLDDDEWQEGFGYALV